MEIPEIKAQLTITQVLDYYGLKADKNNRLCCPFHLDKTPSMQAYPETNTVHCFSSNCKVHGKAIDVIDFILHQEGISKHEAIIKAKELAGYQAPEQPFEKLFKLFQAMLKKDEKAQAYLKERGIEKSVTGFNDGTWEKLNQCIVFPLRDKKGKIVSLYGRSIFNVPGKTHFYSANRKGLYPGYPKADTKQLVITEAIVDAATLLQHTDYKVLSGYGAGVFNPEHEQAIKELPELQEIIIFFDGDEAGRKGVKALSEKLHALRPEIKLSSVTTPEGEDINSLVQSHEAGILTHLIQQRTVLLFSNEEKKAVQTESTSKPERKIPGKFDSSNPLRLVYKTVIAIYYVKGGLRNETDSMRVSLDIEHPDNGRKSRIKLDLYEDKQVEKIAREAAEKLDLRADMIQLGLELLTELLERYREEQNKPKEAAQVQQVSPQYERAAAEFLTKPNLIKRWNDLIGKAGVVGEENNRMFLMVIGTTYKMPDTLHALIQGSSGSGKTHLMAKIFTFIPTDDKKAFTRITEGNLYNWGMYDLCHKFICIEDLDGLKEEALFALRELISKGLIISGTSNKDDNGNVNAMQRIVYGPIASMSCTTKGEIYEDNMGRCFIIAVDESHDQTRRIIEYQNKKAAGQIDEQKETQCAEFIQTMVGLLKSYDVVNPYADKVHLPEEAHKIRRLNGLYQSFVKAITLIHQYQRKRDNRGRLISEKEDLQIAAEIMFESILLKVDELDGSLRQFYERLKKYIKAKASDHHESYEFGQREVRQALHVSKTQLQRYLNDLSALEYIRQSGGHINRGFNYKVLYWDNAEVMRAKVRRHLQGQLDQLELAA